MKKNSHKLIQEYIQLTKQFIEEAEPLLELSYEDLNAKQTENTWSVLETLEHLNLYGDFYIPEIKKRIKESRFKQNVDFSSGLLGGYFVRVLKPREKLNKMKTLKDKDPNGSSLTMSVLSRFLDQQNQMLELLESAKKVDLTKTKTAISISKFIKLRLGDTLGVVVFHNQRHMVQVKNILKIQNHA